MDDARFDQEDKKDVQEYFKSAAKDLAKEYVQDKLKRQLRNKVILAVASNPVTWIIVGVVSVVACLITLVILQRAQSFTPGVDVAQICEDRAYEAETCKDTLRDQSKDKWINRAVLKAKEETN